jgi:hypothetical protein
MRMTPLDPVRQPSSEIFVAQLTSADTSTDYDSDPYAYPSSCQAYSWIEMRLDPGSCGYVPNEWGRFGTPEQNPVYTLNGELLQTPILAYVKLRGWILGQQVYDVVGVVGETTTPYSQYYGSPNCCSECQTIQAVVTCSASNGDGTTTNQFTLTCWPSGQIIFSGCVTVSSCPCNQYYSSPGMPGSCSCDPSCNVTSYVLFFPHGVPADGTCFNCNMFSTTFNEASGATPGYSQWCLNEQATTPYGCVYEGQATGDLCGDVSFFVATLTINDDGSATLLIVTESLGTTMPQAQYHVNNFACGQSNALGLIYQISGRTSACKNWPELVNITPCFDCGFDTAIPLNCPPSGGGSGGTSGISPSGGGPSGGPM